MAQVKLKLTPQNMHDAHKELQEIFVKKNTDYGNSFEESLEKHGLIAAIVRMEDKMSRLSTLSKNEALVKDESVIDTLKDLSNYALMTAVWLEQGEKKEAEVKIPVDYEPVIINQSRETNSPEFIELTNQFERIIRTVNDHWLVTLNVSAFQDDTMDIGVTDTTKAYEYVKEFFKDKDRTFVFEHLPYKDRNPLLKVVHITVIDRIEPIPMPKSRIEPKPEIFKSTSNHPYTATFGVDDHGRPIVVKHHEHDDV